MRLMELISVSMVISVWITLQFLILDSLEQMRTQKEHREPWRRRHPCPQLLACCTAFWEDLCRVYETKCWPAESHSTAQHWWCKQGCYAPCLKCKNNHHTQNNCNFSKKYEWTYILWFLIYHYIYGNVLLLPNKRSMFHCYDFHWVKPK